MRPTLIDEVQKARERESLVFEQAFAVEKAAEMPIRCMKNSNHVGDSDLGKVESQARWRCVESGIE